MNGLEAIQDRILTEAREKADRIMTQAQSQCAEILATAESEKNQLIAADQETTDRMADTLIKRASSAAALEGRRIILQARQAQIDRAMDRALEILSEMPSDEKLPLYRSLLQQTGATAGEITLAAADLDRKSVV